MARRRGFFAEMQHQARVAQRRREQEARAAHRARVAAARDAERARKREERARAQLARAQAAEQKAAEREAKLRHVEAMDAQVSELNARLASDYDDIDSMLEFTLDIDDFVDLEELREFVDHPPFPRPDLEEPLPAPELVEAPAMPPLLVLPARSWGLKGVLTRKHHEAEIAALQAEHDRAMEAWRDAIDSLPTVQMQQIAKHQEAQQERAEALEAAQASYKAGCRARESEAQVANQKLDELIRGLESGVESAVQEYVSIVLANSVYPACFEVEYEFEFDSELHELALSAFVPEPDSVPSTKEFKYVRSKDEITSTDLPKKTRRERYANAIAQVALRTLHEVFESDRSGTISTISLIVTTDAIDPGTGLRTTVPLASVAADRTFLEFDLANVEPISTIGHLSGLISKNPLDLVPIDISRGVRGGS